MPDYGKKTWLEEKFGKRGSDVIMIALIGILLIAIVLRLGKR